MKTRSIHTLVQCAILVAMSTLLSYMKLYEAPLGGSVTVLSMLPVCLAGLMHGPKWGFGTAFIYSVIQLLIGNAFGYGLTPLALVVCILADYIIAFTALGVTGFFKGRGRVAMCIGVAAAVALRMVCHYVSGVTIWAEYLPEGWSNVWLYSLAYNSFYMLPEMVFTMIGVIIISAVPQFRRLIKSEN